MLVIRTVAEAIADLQHRRDWANTRIQRAEQNLADIDRSKTMLVPQVHLLGTKTQNKAEVQRQTGARMAYNQAIEVLEALAEALADPAKYEKAGLDG